MSKFKTVQSSGNSVRRMFLDGVMKVNSVDEEKNYKVSLMLLNGKRNRNGWVYLGLREHLSQFAEIPILCAWVRGKPDGHNFEVKIDPKTGKEYASFVGAESEKMVGWINTKTPTGDNNAYIANIDGTDWICIREALIPSFYNKEFIDELERNGGQLKVSIETLVDENYVDEDGTEYEKVWRVIGVTVISVTEAVAGANIRKKVNSYSEELEKMKLRAAQYYAPDNKKEPQTQNKPIKKNQEEGEVRRMKMLNLEDLKDKFPDYEVLAAKGQTVALCSNKNWRNYLYTLQDGVETVVPEKFEEVAVNCVFGEGDNAISVPAEKIIGVLQAKLNATQKALDEKTAESASTIGELTERLNKMIDAEKVRRKEAVKAAVAKRLAEFNANRAEDEKLDAHACDSILADAEAGKYTDMVDANGVFCGDANACKDVDVLCVNRQNEIQKAKADAARANSQKHYAWELPGGGKDAENKGSAGIRGVIERMRNHD